MNWVLIAILLLFVGIAIKSPSTASSIISIQTNNTTIPISNISPNNVVDVATGNVEIPVFILIAIIIFLIVVS